MNLETMSAILALDTYNRGYNQAVKINIYDADFNQEEIGRFIGRIEIIDQSDPAQFSDEVSDGFYAVAYKALSGINVSGMSVDDIIISYRGTDIALSWPWELIGSDIWNGYGIGTLSARGKQAKHAIEFYKTIVGAGDLQDNDISLTGHSLGGGLAGVVGGLYGRPGLLFDNMAFEGATANAYIEAGTAASLKTLIYGSDPRWLPDFGALETIWMHQEFLQFNRLLQSTPKRRLVPGNARLGDFDRAASFAGNTTFALHSQALLVLALFGLDEWAGEGGTTNWQKSAKYFLPPLFDDNIASSIDSLSGHIGNNGTPAGVLASSIAYSVLTEGDTDEALPFGNTAVRVLFNDADDLGLALDGNGSVLSLEQSANENRIVAHGLGDLIVQYAGSLAIGDVTNDNEVADGILTVDDDSKTLKVNLGSYVWGLGSGVSEISYRERIFEDTIFAGMDIVAREPILSGAMTLWGQPNLDIVDRVFLAYEDDLDDVTLPGRDDLDDEVGVSLFVGGNGGDVVTAADGEDSILFGGGGDDRLTGGSGWDLLVGGKGQDILRGGEGNDYLIGGDDRDQLFGDGGDDILVLGSDQDDNPDLVDGGDGDDAIDFSGLGDGIEFDLSKAINTSAGKRHVTGSGTRSSNIEWVIGTAYDDVLKGNGEGTVLQGGDGNDEIHLYNGDIGYGGDGADKFYIYTDRSYPDGSLEYYVGEFDYTTIVNSTLIIDLEEEDELYVDGLLYTGFRETVLPGPGEAVLYYEVDVIDVDSTFDYITTKIRDERVGSYPLIEMDETYTTLTGRGEISFEKFLPGHTRGDSSAIQHNYLQLVGYNYGDAGIEFRKGYISLDGENIPSVHYTNGLDPSSYYDLHETEAEWDFNDIIRLDRESKFLREYWQDGFAEIHDTLPELLKYDPYIWSLFRDDPYPGMPERGSSGSSGSESFSSGFETFSLEVDLDDDTLMVDEDEDGIASLNVLTNDLDLVGTTKQITSVNGVEFTGSSISITTSWGSITVYQAGTVEYDLDEVAVASIGGLWFDEWIEETLTYTAEDDLSNTSDGTLTITVGNINAAPTAPASEASVVASNVFSGRVRASDKDFDTLSFDLLAGPSKGSIVFDDATGAYRYTTDFDATGTDTISVGVSDGNGGSITTSVTFTISAPILSLVGNQIFENAPDGLSVGAAAVNVDDSLITLTYRLIDDADGRFDIDEDTGEIFVEEGSLLDYETATSHDITIGASDGTHEITGIFTINVENDESDDEEEEMNDPGDTESVNIITGTSSGETLNGTAGRDQISGLGGNDTLYGLGGNDVLNGGSGDDILYGGDGNDILKASTGSNQLFGGPGSDTVDYSDRNPQNNQVHTFYLSHHQFNIGMGENDTYDSIENIRGSQKTDIIYATSYDNIIEGRSYNDTLWGGAGNDIYVYDSTMYHHDTIQEGDFEVGSYGDVSLTGLDGGVDTIAFGSNVGIGTLYLTVDGDDLLLRPGTGYVRILNHVVDPTQAVEFIQFADGLRVSTDHLRYYIYSNPNWGVGDANDNLIVGTPTNNTLYGYGGNDAIGGAGGNDSLYGGDGDDHLEGGAGGDLIDGGSNNTRGIHDTDRSIMFGDTARYVTSDAAVDIDLYLGTASGGHAAGDTLASIENLVGSHNYGDTLKGDAGENWLKGLGGNDELDGRGGDDILDGGDGDDILIGGDGADILYGGSGDDELDGGNGHDIALFAGLRSSYTVTTVGGAIQITDDNAYADGDDGTDTLIGIETAQFKGGATLSLASPVVLDLDGNGVNLVSKSQSRAKFDLDGDGIRDKTGWVSKGDGILVFDRNGDGKLSGVNEISFIDDKPGARSDLDGLSAFDTNGDGRLDARDAQFSSFKVWRDKDGDGKVDKKELMTLKKAGVAAIELSGTAVEREWGWDDNIVVNTGTFVRTNGRRQALADVALNFDGSRRDVSGFADIGSGRSNIGYAPLTEIENWTRGETDTAFAAGSSTAGGMRDRQVEALVTAMASFGTANFDAVSLAQNIASLRRDFFAAGGKFTHLF